MPIPSTSASLSALARLTFIRILRGKLLWVGFAIAALPLAMAGGARNTSEGLKVVFGMEMFVLAILPPLFAAPSIGEELEDRTSTYLWSRPLPRWTILVGKLLALAPFAMVLLTASWIGAMFIALHEPPPPLTIAAIAIGTLAISVVSAGIATVAPKRGMSFAIIYTIIDLSIGAIPASVQWLSVTHATRTLAGLENSSPLSGLLALVILGGFWLFLAFRRISKIET